MIYERVVHGTKFEDIARVFKTSKSTANLVYKQYKKYGHTNRKLNSMERMSLKMSRQKSGTEIALQRAVLPHKGAKDILFKVEKNLPKVPSIANEQDQPRALYQPPSCPLELLEDVATGRIRLRLTKIDKIQIANTVDLDAIELIDY